MPFIALALWGAIMIGAIFYTQEARHPDTKPLAAYLIFITVFSAAAFFIFSSLTVLLAMADLTALLDNPLVAAVFLLAVFAPAFLLGRWQLHKPPRRPQRL
ncbi:MAG: hypothetical protein ACFCUW_12010 [Kiloniellaceae bacterium]